MYVFTFQRKCVSEIEVVLLMLSEKKSQSQYRQAQTSAVSVGLSCSIQELCSPLAACSLCACHWVLLGMRLLWKSFSLAQDIPWAEESSSLPFPSSRVSARWVTHIWLPLSWGVVEQQWMVGHIAGRGWGGSQPNECLTQGPRAVAFCLK